MSMDTSMEDDEDSFDSNTDAILYGTSDHSGESMISGPNIVSSASSEDDDYHHQQILMAVAGGTDDLMTVSSCASSSWFTNNYNKQSDPQEAIMIFNVDFRALSSEVAVCNNSDNNEVVNYNTEIKNIEQSVNLNSCWEMVREEENEVMMKEEVRREQLVLASLLTPSSWSSICAYSKLKNILLR